MASFGAQEKTSEEIRGAQHSNASQLNMVAERAIRYHGRSDSKREGSEQHDLPGKQQPNIPEHELQRRRFRRIHRVDSRDIQNKFNNKFQDAVGAAPSESSQLGPKRAQLDNTSSDTLLILTRPETSSRHETSTRTVPSRFGMHTEAVSVCSEVNFKDSSTNDFQNKSFHTNFKEGGFKTSCFAWHRSGGRNSTTSFGSKSSDKSETSTDNNC